MGFMTRMLAERLTFCPKYLAHGEWERDDREPSHRTVGVYAYDTHRGPALLERRERKNMPQCSIPQSAGQRSEKVGCALIPSQIILTHKAHAL